MFYVIYLCHVCEYPRSKNIVHVVNWAQTEAPYSQLPTPYICECGVYFFVVDMTNRATGSCYLTELLVQWTDNPLKHVVDDAKMTHLSIDTCLR